MRLFRYTLAACLLLAMPLAAPISAATDEPTPLRRWFGAEAGYIETRCWGPSPETGCLSFNSTQSFDGLASSEKTNSQFDDPDLQRRFWPARTGMRFFRFAVPGGLPSFAHLTTLGAPVAPSSPMTASFGLRFHTLPIQPVVIYRHTGATPEQNIMLTLNPEGSIGISAFGYVGVSLPLTTEAWHAVTVAYGTTKGSQLRLQVNEQPALVGTVRMGGPIGHLDLGIVSPTSTPFALAIDDYVETPLAEAPTHKARINYLMPYGSPGQDEWDKIYAQESCRELARNWQLVSENQAVFSDDIDGNPGYCHLEGGAITTQAPGMIDRFHLEGVPSKHKPAFGYPRDVLAQPTAQSSVLGFRMRMRGRTEGPPVSWLLGYEDQGELVSEEFDYESGTGAGYLSAWGDTHQVRPNGDAWSSGSLNALKLELNSGEGTGGRYVTEIYLDYVWVP